MGVFSSNSGYLGVDLGTSSIKVAELANFKGRPRLLTYGFTERKLSDSSSGDNAPADVSEMASALSDICRKSRTSSKKVIAALPNFAVFTSVLNLPALSKKELASAISWEAKKIIPIPLEEIILDWKIISEAESGVAPSPPQENSVSGPSSDGEKAKLPDKGDKSEPAKDLASQVDNPQGSASSGVDEEPGADESVEPKKPSNQETGSFRKIFSKPKKNLKILLTGASKKLVRRYIEIFNKAGLSLLSLETESFAQIRSLIGNDKTTIMMVDLGATTSSVSIVDRGLPVVNRSIEVGGLMITKAISNSLNINMDRAEQFKQDMSLGGDTANNSLPQIVEKSFSSILNEIKYTLNFFQDQSGKKVEKVILTGGSASLGNLSGYLSGILGINTYLGDPWARIVYPTELKPVLDRLGPRFAVSIGLAMRDID